VRLGWSSVRDAACTLLQPNSTFSCHNDTPSNKHQISSYKFRLNCHHQGSKMYILFVGVLKRLQCRDQNNMKVKNAQPVRIIPHHKNTKQYRIVVSFLMMALKPKHIGANYD